MASFRSQLGIADVAIDGRVEQRAPSRYQSGASVPEVRHDLLETINAIRNLLRAFEAPFYCDFPSVLEGVSRKLFFALKVPVNPAFFQTSGSHEIGKRSNILFD